MYSLYWEVQVHIHHKKTRLSTRIPIYDVCIGVYRTVRTVYEKARIGIMCGLDEQLPPARNTDWTPLIRA